MPRPVNALIIDDEPHVIVLLKGLLKQLGMETIWDASDGAAGLEKTASMKPHVVLLDLNLPRVDGLEVLAQLKEKHPDIPVVVVSAQSTLRTINRARELGAVSYVLKHAPKSEVMQTLSDAFDAIAEKSGGATAAEGKEPAAPA
ncbi:MAG TPA: response regulator [Opitutaceae bacterium]